MVATVALTAVNTTGSIALTAKLKGVSGVRWSGDCLVVGEYLVGPTGVYACSTGRGPAAAQLLFPWDEYVGHVSPATKTTRSLKVMLMDGREVVLVKLTPSQVLGFAQALRRIGRMREARGKP